jgi:phosphopentomutase
MKRVFLIVLDSFGIGAMPDSADYGDSSVNTLRSISKSEKFKIENLKKMGLFNIDGVECGEKQDNHTATICRLKELSKGKDTTIGHWEIAGIVSQKPLPTYPDGFPESVLNEFTRRTGRKVICNKPYSGTDVIRDYGDEHIKTGALIVYTSADSVFQIAAHEDIVPLEELYNYCKIAREILCGEHGVGRVIARPFKTENGKFVRTANRHDYSLQPPKDTMLDILKANGKDTIAVGKIYDIFAGKGISEHIYTTGNTDGMQKTIDYAKSDFNGICFTNLVDFDMLYGHRRDIDGYANALSEFDSWLCDFLPLLKEEDILIITADHGCDPAYLATTDHTREYVPLIIYGDKVKNQNLGTRNGFCNIADMVCDYLLEEDTGSILSEILK